MGEGVDNVIDDVTGRPQVATEGAGNVPSRMEAEPPGRVNEPMQSTGSYGSSGLPTSGLRRISPLTGNPILTEAKYITPSNAIIEASKPSRQGKLGISQRYENPGHHDPNLRSPGRGQNKYNPNKSILPDNHVELFDNSVPYTRKDGAVYRYAQDESGTIHRFQPSSEGINDFHWNGSTNGMTRNGSPRKINLNDIPSEIRRRFGV